MWECPDYFPVNGRDILLFSPQGILPTEYHYHNPHAAGYIVGDVNFDTLKFESKSSFKELDHGFDFYAPQTFEDEKGRRILWAWMGIGDIEPEYSNPTVARGWQHAMALPRQITFENNKLKQRPSPEYQELRANQQAYDLTELTSGSLTGEVYELLLEFEDTPKSLEISLRQDTQITYQDGIFMLKHGESGYGRRKRRLPMDQLSQLQIFSDTSSLEIFINDGDAVFTSRVYPDPQQDRIEIKGDGTGQVTYWDLKHT